MIVSEKKDTERMIDSYKRKQKEREWVDRTLV